MTKANGCIIMAFIKMTDGQYCDFVYFMLKGGTAGVEIICGK